MTLIIDNAVYLLLDLLCSIYIMINKVNSLKSFYEAIQNEITKEVPFYWLKLLCQFIDQLDSILN